MIHEVIRIDMSLTDEHIYTILKNRLPATGGRMSYEEIAQLARCAPCTAKRSAKRLEAAGRIELEGGSGNRKVFYKVIHEQAHMD